jgi:hypothetical protein
MVLSPSTTSTTSTTSTSTSQLPGQGHQAQRSQVQATQTQMPSLRWQPLRSGPHASGRSTPWCRTTRCAPLLLGAGSQARQLLRAGARMHACASMCASATWQRPLMTVHCLALTLAGAGAEVALRLDFPQCQGQGAVAQVPAAQVQGAGQRLIRHRVQGCQQGHGPGGSLQGEGGGASKRCCRRARRVAPAAPTPSPIRPPHALLPGPPLTATCPWPAPR